MPNPATNSKLHLGLNYDLSMHCMLSVKNNPILALTVCLGSLFG